MKKVLLQKKKKKKKLREDIEKDLWNKSFRIEFQIKSRASKAINKYTVYIEYLWVSLIY
jgi:hypothetical protein